MGHEWARAPHFAIDRDTRGHTEALIHCKCIMIGVNSLIKAGFVLYLHVNVVGLVLTMGTNS
jgi:hypothetical protein